MVGLRREGLGHAVRTADRLQGEREAGFDIGRDGHADADRQLRRSLGIGRRDAAPHRREGRRAGEPRSHSELRERVRGLKDQPHNTVDGVSYGVAHGRGANLLIWNTDEIPGEQTSWEHRVGDGLAGGREDLGLRQPDLHRGRRGVPHGDAAGSQHHGSVRARRRAVQCRRRAPEAAEGDGRRVLELGGDSDPVVCRRQLDCGYDLAVPGQPAPGCRSAGTRAGNPSRRKGRPDGRTHG